MTALTQNSLKVGKVSVGLLGLDMALMKVAARPDLDIASAVEQVMAAITARNYIPAAAVEAYREAIEREIIRLREGRKPREDNDLVIRILGPGCVSCNNLQKMVIEIMGDVGIAADIFQVHDLDEIGRYGVMQTPALVINNRVRCAGRLPTRSKVEEWLRESLR